VKGRTRAVEFIWDDANNNKSLVPQ
jgi:hypothetical protein